MSRRRQHAQAAIGGFVLVAFASLIGSATGSNLLTVLSEPGPGAEPHAHLAPWILMVGNGAALAFITVIAVFPRYTGKATSLPDFLVEELRMPKASVLAMVVGAAFGWLSRYAALQYMPGFDAGGHLSAVLTFSFAGAAGLTTNDALRGFRWVLNRSGAAGVPNQM